MGLFDRRREEPAPAPKPKPKPAAAPAAKQAAPQAQPKVQVNVQKPAPAPAPAPKPAAAPKPEFGIEKAIELMRKLPADNIPLVVQVVRTTLESTNVDVKSIISDAEEKRDRISRRIDGLKTEIADFKEEIAAREEQIARMETDAAETKTVQERLEMAMNGGRPIGQSSMERAVFEDPVPKPPF